MREVEVGLSGKTAEQRAMKRKRPHEDLGKKVSDRGKSRFKGPRN